MKKLTTNIRFVASLCLILTAPFFTSAMADTSADYTQESMEFSIARGGRLYDKWFKENEVGTPKEANASYPDEGKYKGKKGADFRCKECHGWDYKGNTGAYSSGKHFTGIGGIEHASKLSPEKIAGILRDSTHNYGEALLSDKDLGDLVNFVKFGQMDMSVYIDSKSKRVLGNAKEGKKYYQTLCATCHGLDGKEEDTPPLGQLANKNPWEVMHKMQNGQPDEEMPVLRALDTSIVVDLLSYIQTSLPKE